MLTLGLNLEHEASLHYTISDEHASDKRRLESRLRVTTSSDFPESRWLQSRDARRNVGEALLVKVKDMMLPASCLKTPLPGRGSLSWRPNPGDRACQRGVSAMQHLLRSLFAWMGFSGRPQAAGDAGQRGRVWRARSCGDELHPRRA